MGDPASWTRERRAVGREPAGRVGGIRIAGQQCGLAATAAEVDFAQGTAPQGSAIQDVPRKRLNASESAQIRPSGRSRTFSNRKSAIVPGRRAWEHIADRVRRSGSAGPSRQGRASGGHRSNRAGRREWSSVRASEPRPPPRSPRPARPAPTRGATRPGSGLPSRRTGRSPARGDAPQGFRECDDPVASGRCCPCARRR